MFGLSQAKRMNAVAMAMEKNGAGNSGGEYGKRIWGEGLCVSGNRNP